MNKLNILIFSTDYKPNGGGIAEHTYQIAKYLHKQGYSLIVLSVKKTGSKKFDENQLFKTYRVSNITFLRNLFLLVYLLYLCKKERIKYVYSTMTHPCGEIAFIGSLFLHYKTIISVHGYEVSYSGTSLRNNLKRKFKWIRSYIYNHIDKVFTVSEYTKQRLIRSGVHQSQIQVFPNGVDIDEWKDERKDKELLQKYGLEEKKILLTVGSLVKRKGHDIVIKSLNLVKTKIPNVRYLIAGEGPNGNHLKNLVKKEGVEEFVIFLGRVPQPRLKQLYYTCDVFVMPNREEGTSVEGFGIVFLEANACGKPVIGGRSGGVLDAVIDGKTGLLVEPENPKEIATALLKLLKNEEFAKQIGEQGYERVKNELTWDKIVSKMVSTLKDISNKK